MARNQPKEFSNNVKQGKNGKDNKSVNKAATAKWIKKMKAECAAKGPEYCFKGTTCKKCGQHAKDDKLMAAQIACINKGGTWENGKCK